MGKTILQKEDKHEEKSGRLMRKLLSRKLYKELLNYFTI